MSLHKLIDGTHSRWIGDKVTGHRKDYVTGDIMEDLTPSEIKNFGTRVQVIYDDASEVHHDQQVQVPEVQKKHIVLLSSSASIIGANIDRYTIDELREIAIEEESGSARKGVLKMIHDRIEELEAV